MTKEQLAAIRERVEKASPGPWVSEHGTITCHSKQSVVKAEDDFDWICSMQISNQPNSLNDGKFIAHARQDIPALLAYVEELEKFARSEAKKSGTALNTDGSEILVLAYKEPQGDVIHIPTCDCGRPLSPGKCSICDNDD